MGLLTLGVLSNLVSVVSSRAQPPPGTEVGREPSPLSSNEDLPRIAGPFKGFEVTGLELSGVPRELNAGAIQAGLALAGRRGIFQKQKPQLYVPVLQADIDRVRLYLARHGYPRSQVDPELEKRGERSVRVRLVVRPGSAVTVSTTAIVGLAESVARSAHSQIDLEPGRPVVDEEVLASSAAIRRWLEDRGHARSRVEAELVALDSFRVEVRFVATPGPVYFIEELRIDGTSADLVPLVRKTAGIETGTLYSPAELAQAHDQLRLLDLFRQIRINPVFADSSEGRIDLVPPEQRRELDLRIDLSDIAPRTLETGVGYWTDDFIRGQLAWKHRNLFGGGRGFRARGFYSLHRQDVTAGVWWPALIWPRTRGEIQARVERESEESYITVTERVDFSLLYRPNLRMNYRGGIRFSSVDLEVLTEDPEAFDESGGYATVFFGELLLDVSDDRLNPERGGIVSAGAEVSVPQVLSDTPYLKAEGSATHYQRLIGSRLIGAGRLAGGWARPIGDAQDLLPNERFFAGGVNSMRGFKRRKLGPLDAEAAPIGGEALLEGSLELRFPIWGKLVGAVFVDTGQVWQQRNSLRLSDLEVAVGGGIGFRTPIGPIRGDVGTRLTDIIPGQPETVFHLAIGNPF